MIAWLWRRWNRLRRAGDIDILWPSCRDNAPTLDMAHKVFLWHTQHDPAWSDLPEAEIERIVEALK